MKNCASILNRLILATFLLGSTGLPAEDNAPPKGIVPPPDIQAAWKRRIPELNVDGWPVSEIVSQLRKQFPELNFIVTHGANEQGIRVLLRSVTLDEILKGLEIAAEGQLQITRQDERLVVFDKPHATTEPRPASCRVFNLSNYLGNRVDKEAEAALKELNQALDSAWNMLATANGEQDTTRKPMLNMHRGTKLLIAVGRPDDLEVIDQVVQQLQYSTRASNSPVPPDLDREARAKMGTNESSPPKKQ
jgi:hypothetical protein